MQLARNALHGLPIDDEGQKAAADKSALALAVKLIKRRAHGMDELLAELEAVWFIVTLTSNALLYVLLSALAALRHVLRVVLFFVYLVVVPVAIVIAIPANLVTSIYFAFQSLSVYPPTSGQ